jgi:hypothetical protein
VSIRVVPWVKASILVTRTVGSWVLIPLKACMSVLVFLCCVVLCCVGRVLATNLTPSTQEVLPAVGKVCRKCFRKAKIRVIKTVNYKLITIHCQKCAEHVMCVRVMRNVYRIVVWKLEMKRPFGTLAIYGKIILKLNRV